MTQINVKFQQTTILENVLYGIKTITVRKLMKLKNMYKHPHTELEKNQLY